MRVATRQRPPALHLVGGAAVTTLPNRICSVEGCAKPHRSLGLCNKHYIRQWRTGTVNRHKPSATLPHEEWRPVPTLEGRYEASTHGRLRWVGPPVGSTYPGRVIEAKPDKNGYLIVKPYPRPDRRGVGIHRLVAWAFHGPCPDGHEVNHIDGDPTNNRPENLEYVTHAENVQHSWEVLGRKALRGQAHPRAKLSECDVRAIRARAAAGETISQIAADYPVNHWSVGAVIRRVTWDHI